MKNKLLLIFTLLLFTIPLLAQDFEIISVESSSSFSMSDVPHSKQCFCIMMQKYKKAMSLRIIPRKRKQKL